LPSAMTPSPCGPSRADPRPNRSVHQASVDQRITAVLADASQPRPFSDLRASCRVRSTTLYERLAGHDRRGHRHEIRQRLQPHRSLNYTAPTPAERHAGTILDITASPNEAAPRHRADAACHTPYSQREAEAGSPSKSETARPSNSVIVLKICCSNGVHMGSIRNGQ
jgi:hypothetical protein